MLLCIFIKLSFIPLLLIIHARTLLYGSLHGSHFLLHVQTLHTKLSLEPNPPGEPVITVTARLIRGPTGVPEQCDAPEFQITEAFMFGEAD